MSDSPEAARPLFSIPLLLVAGCLVAWLTGLGVLTQVRSPAVVNQRQVRRADSVVLATIEDTASGRIRIDSVLAGETPPDRTLVISNLDQVDVSDGQQVIAPLWRTGKIVKVSNPAKPKLGRPVVYADTAAVRDQLAAALKRGPIRE